MEIVGYDRDDLFTDHLKEATITCTYDELKRIASFIDTVLKECDENGKCCLHFRDYAKEWDSKSSDLIILIP